jgi:hypothetical protein
MLCPEGSEGVTYALLTTVSIDHSFSFVFIPYIWLKIANLAWSVSFDIGTAFTSIWDVSNSTLQKGDFSGVLNLTLLTRSQANCFYNAISIGHSFFSTRFQ